MIYLIDSNVVSELMRPAPSDKVVTWLDRHAGNCALPTIAIYEVRAGINTIPPGRRRDELMGAFERIVARFGPRVVSFDRSSAEMAASLRKDASLSSAAQLEALAHAEAQRRKMHPYSDGIAAS